MATVKTKKISATDYLIKINMILFKVEQISAHKWIWTDLFRSVKSDGIYKNKSMATKEALAYFEDRYF